MDGTTRRTNYDYEHVGLPWFRVSSPLRRPPGLEDYEPHRVSSPVPIGPGTTATLTVRRLQGELSSRPLIHCIVCLAYAVEQI